MQTQTSSKENFVSTTDLNVLAMSTKEIADLTGKRHDHVVRDVKAMLRGIYGNQTAVSFGSHSPDLGNEGIQGVRWSRDNRGFIEAFHLDKSHTMTLISGYDVRVRKRIVDRWLELESGEATRAPTRDIGQLANALHTVSGLVERMVSRTEALERRLDAADAKRAEEREQARITFGIEHDPRVAALDYSTVFGVMVKFKVPRKGRGKFVPRVRASLIEHAAATRTQTRNVREQVGRPGDIAFPISMIDDWAVAHGHAMIAAHLARRPFVREPESQGKLFLVPKDR